MTPWQHFYAGGRGFLALLVLTLCLLPWWLA